MGVQLIWLDIAKYEPFKGGSYIPSVPICTTILHSPVLLIKAIGLIWLVVNQKHIT